MAKKMLCLVVFAALLVMFGAGAASGVGSGPKPVTQGIPVDADAYYKGLDGQAAASRIAADTAEVSSELAASAAAAGHALGVGDVEFLYADGWQEFTLRALDGNAEIWVANDLSYPAGDPRPTPVVTQDQVDYLLAEFNDTIYPSTTGYFGFTADRDGTGGLFSSWGYDWYETDNPQRVMILVFNIIDEAYDDPEFPFYTAGYFWPEMNDAYANRNIIHIDSHDWENRVGPDVERPYLYEQTFTHEYEHAIHYDHDADETSWVDEGLADLAPYLCGYGHSAGHIAYYMVYHRTPLTTWGGGLEDYGESYLFQLYLLENFGGPAFVSALVNEPANGIAGIENALATVDRATDFDDIYRDWTLANLLDDTSRDGLSGAALGYDSLAIPSDDTWGYSIQWSVDNYYGSDNHGNLPLARYWGGYKSGTVQYPIDTVAPYGPMYLTYSGIQPLLLSDFRGDVTGGIAPFSGTYELWGGRGDLMVNAATMSSPVSLGTNPSLSFWTNYQIEEGWDFGFVQVSLDGGYTWTSLENADTTYDHDPSAISTAVDNLPGFTGSSGGWVEEIFDLAPYAEQDVLIRFLYVTDWGYTEAGFYVDDVTVSDDSGTVFSDGLEAGADGWTLEGWERTTGLAANDWALTFVNPKYDKGKLKMVEITDAVPVLSDGFLRDFTTLDTSRLNRDEATIVMSNRLPEATSFPAGYRLLVRKGARLQ